MTGSPTSTTRPSVTDVSSSTIVPATSATTTPTPYAIPAITFPAAACTSPVATDSSCPGSRPASPPPRGSTTRRISRIRSSCAAVSVARSSARAPSRYAVDKNANRTANTPTHRTKRVEVTRHDGVVDRRADHDRHQGLEPLVRAEQPRRPARHATGGRAGRRGAVRGPSRHAGTTIGAPARGTARRGTANRRPLDQRRVDDLGRRPFGDDRAVTHRDQVRRVAARVVQIVEHGHQRPALDVQLRAQVHDLDLVGDVEERDRLVQQQQRRLLGQRHGDPHALPLAARQLVHQPPGDLLDVRRPIASWTARSSSRDHWRSSR